jgi:pimeloyl-ACP methyl ester carboxylesterase
MSRPESYRNGSTPTVLLVHGAFADGSSWSGVIAELQAAGIQAVAPANPLRGLVGDSACIVSVVAQYDGPVLLVGHSYGGAVIGVAAARTANVVGLVFVNAFALEEGESCTDAGQDYPKTSFAASLRYAECPVPSGKTAIDLYQKLEAFPRSIAGGLSAERAAVLAAVQRPVAASALDEKAPTAAWKTLPSWYVVGTEDQAIHPEAQRFMARRARANTIEVKGSHLALISHPDSIARHIQNAVCVTTPGATCT